MPLISPLMPVPQTGRAFDHKNYFYSNINFGIPSDLEWFWKSGALKQ